MADRIAPDLKGSGLMLNRLRPSRWRFTTAFVAAGTLALLAGCGSSPALVSGPTPEQIELQNMKTSVEMVRDALEEMADDRDRFQDLYLTSSTELSQRRKDVELLEARHRARLLEERSATTRIAELDRSLERATESNSQYQVVIKNLRESQDRNRERLEASDRERIDFQRQIAELEAQRDRLDTALAKTVEQSDQRQRQVEILESQQEVGMSTVQENLRAREREVAQLRQEVEVLRPLHSEVNRLQGALDSSEKAKNAAVALRHKSESQLGDQARVEAPTPEDLGALSLAFLRQNTDEIKNGKWNQRNSIVLGVAVAIVFGALFVLIALVRGRGWKKKALAAQGSGIHAEPIAVASTSSPAPRFTVPPELARPVPSALPPQEEAMTQIIGPGSMPTAPTPAAPVPPARPVFEEPQEAMTQIISVPSAAAPSAPKPPAPRPAGLESEAATQMVGSAGGEAEWNSAVTEDLGEFLRQHGVKVDGDDSGSAEASRSDTDDDLLEDLRDVIRDKFG